MFTVKGRNFDSRFAFPPINEDKIQNAIMLAPTYEHSNEMFVWGWNCSIEQDGSEVWGWEPLFPLSANDGMDFIRLVSDVKEGLGI